MIGQEKVYETLKALGIEFDYLEHPEAPTIEIARQYWKNLDSTHCKNLFFRNHKGNRHYLVIFHCDRNLAIHDLEQLLKQGKLSFASEKRMEKYLGLKPGSVSPFGLVNDTEQQKTIYQIALQAHQAAVAALRPGIPFKEVHLIAARTIAEGMKSIGLMKGDPDEAARSGAYALFFPCGLGHMMGLDVHDMENLGEVWVGYNGQPKSTQFGFKSLRLARPLEPGFVFTIEPGIYFIPELIDYWRSEKRFCEFIQYDKLEAWKGFSGIRNEEDYLITPDGARRLGKYKPMTIGEVEGMK